MQVQLVQLDHQVHPEMQVPMVPQVKKGNLDPRVKRVTKASVVKLVDKAMLVCQAPLDQ